jgi:hypothetical protein
VLSRAIQTTRGRLVLLLSAVAILFFGTAALAHFVLDLFPGYGEALWSAVLHLLDPSSLHDDDSGKERAIGLFQVMTGLVLLVGVLFTLIAETVGSSIERLGRLDPAVRARDHVLVLGGIDLLTEAANALTLAAEEVDRRPAVVFVAPEDARPNRRRLLEELRRVSAPLKVELVFGETGDRSGFELGKAEFAETILLMPKTSGPIRAEASDVEVIQAGLALEDYLKERGATPGVRGLFRRGRHVDAVWGLFPDEWDAIVTDRIVSGIIRIALTGLERVPEVEAILDPGGGGDTGLLRRAREAAQKEGRPLRLTIVGCGISTQALMEDVVQAGAENFELTMLAESEAFEANLGREDNLGVTLRYRDTALRDADLLGARLAEADPDVVLVTPSPTSGDLRLSDAEATLTLLNVLLKLGPEVPVLGELFLLESVERLPGTDPRLLPLSVLQAVSGAVAMTIFDPERSRHLQRSLEADDLAADVPPAEPN